MGRMYGAYDYTDKQSQIIPNHFNAVAPQEAQQPQTPVEVIERRSLPLWRRILHTLFSE